MLLSEFWDTDTQKHTVMDASCGSLQTLFSRILSPRHLAVNWTGSVHTPVSYQRKKDCLCHDWSSTTIYPMKSLRGTIFEITLVSQHYLHKFPIYYL